MEAPEMAKIRPTYALTILCLCTAAAATAQSSDSKRDASLADFTSETLIRFSSDREFARYVQAVDRARSRRQARATARRPRLQFAQAQSEVQSTEPEEPVCADPELCPEIEAEENFESSIAVTGSRIASRSLTTATPNPSITNNQMAGVDEGDIVKQIGQYLIVLQDGRLFVVDTRAGGGRELALVDRADVYRGRGSATWYDEMLVQGDRIVVTAYSYGEGASEVSVFRLGDGGRVRREGVFLITSNDYYSTTNYATRLVGDSLVVYTPYSLDRWNGFGRGGRWPTVRRWLPREERRAAIGEGTRLFDAPQIYRPVRDILYPQVHTVSVCPLGPLGAGRDLACRTTAFVGPEKSELYVTSNHVYLWTNASWNERPSGIRRGCGPGEPERQSDVTPATVFRVPVAGGPPEVLAAHGRPIDQFSLEANETRLRGLIRFDSLRCTPTGRDEPVLTFLNMPLDRFGPRLRELPEDLYTDLPPTESFAIANRFTDRYLVYGSLARSRFNPGDEDFRTVPSRTFAVPVDRPQGVRRIAVPHNVLRAERAGNDIVLTGYRDRTGLRISLVDLDRTPRIASTAHLRNRFESEGRSHAFNSLMEGDGSGIMGIPTIYRATDRPVTRSEGSDVSYLTADAGGRLAAIGELASDGRRRNPAYRCEVSCIDWYGNSRPIFTDGRVFGLSGTELIEGEVNGERIREVRRVDLTAEPERR
jgi:hypothetical protein